MYYRTVAATFLALLSIAAVRAKAADTQPGVLDFTLGMTMDQVKQTLQKHAEFKVVNTFNGPDQATGQPFPVVISASAAWYPPDPSEVRQSDSLFFQFSPPWDGSKVLGIGHLLAYRGGVPAKGAPVPPSVSDLETALLQRYGGEHYTDIVGNVDWVWPMDPPQMSADDLLAKCVLQNALASNQLFQPRDGCGRIVQVSFNNNQSARTRVSMVTSYVVDYPAIVDVQKRAAQVAADNARKAGTATGQQAAKPVL